MISEELLRDLYIHQKKSSFEIAENLGCSVHKVNYWMDKYSISRRSQSEATYVKRNPNGDPFKLRKPKTFEEAVLYGLGLGLYWGEGTKASMSSVRLGNTDPELIARFMNFLCLFYSLEKRNLHFSLQLFHDNNVNESLDFWCKYLKISREQFSKPVFSPSQSTGTYKRKARYGVVTVQFNNTKLRKIIAQQLAEIWQWPFSAKNTFSPRNDLQSFSASNESSPPRYDLEKSFTAKK